MLVLSNPATRSTLGPRGRRMGTLQGVTIPQLSQLSERQKNIGLFVGFTAALSSIVWLASKIG